MERRASSPGLSTSKRFLSLNAASRVSSSRDLQGHQKVHCENRSRLPLPQDPSVILSVLIITHNEESNIGRTLASVQPLVADSKGEIIVIDSGSTDRTVEIAKSFGAKVFVEEWKGYAAQKNSAIDKATGNWILSLDADEEVDEELRGALRHYILGETAHSVRDGVDVVRKSLLATTVTALQIHRKNYFLGRWIKHGGFWPDPKLRLFRQGCGRFEERAVHETVKVTGRTATLKHGAILHHSYPTIADYVDHMNRYSSLGAEMVVAEGRTGFSVVNI